MQFLTQHWHCLFPLAGIILAAFLFRDNGGKQRVEHRKETDETQSL